jgi:hypothetical protein
MQVFQSRWGFHPCNYSSFLLLKRAHAAYWRARRLAARWRRWHARQPHNRGPEPAVPGVLCEILRSEIVPEYQQARHGVPREEVRPLGIPLPTLEAWAARLGGEAPPAGRGF